MSKLIKRLLEIYWSKIASPMKYARHLGVTIGKNCLISTRNWSTEPYLVTIGDNVQITNGVQIHTHGGAILSEKIIRSLMCLERWLLKTGLI